MKPRSSEPGAPVPTQTMWDSRGAATALRGSLWVALALCIAFGCGGEPSSTGPATSANETAQSSDSLGLADDVANGAGDLDGAATDTATDIALDDALGPDGAQVADHGGGDAPTDGATSGDGGDAAPSAAKSGACPAYVAPTQVGTLGDPRIDELSGLVASRQHDDVLWGHNDSGEKHARMFAVDGTGALRTVLRLGTITPTDTEDIAIGPCSSAPSESGTSCLYLGDIGDNDHIRAEVQAYRAAEPATIATAGSDVELKLTDANVEILRWTYPVRPDLKGKARAAAERPDVEAMVVLTDGRIVLLDKRDDGITQLFRVQPSTTPKVAEAIGTLTLADGALVSGPSLRVTAADLSDDGTQLLVRCYFRAYQIDVAGLLLADPTTASAGLAKLPRFKLTTGFDVQGEAATWARQGGFWHASEGESAPVFFVGCAEGK